MSEVKCNQCGLSIPDGAEVCPHCGAPAPGKKGLPIALIAAFFIIGVLLGFQFIDSTYYRELRHTLMDDAGREKSPAAENHQSPQPVPRTQASRPEPAPQVAENSTEPLICDQEMAKKIRAKAREIAEISEAPGVLSVRLRKQWAYYSPGIRESFLQAFAESDACLQGHSREIRFFYQGEQIAISRALKGLQLDEK